MLDARGEGEAPFLRELARRLRALDGEDAWDGRSDREVLAPLVNDRRPSDGGEHDADVYLRIELFYDTVAALVEARTGIPCAPMLRMHHDGHGRAVVLAGRLVVVTRSFADAPRFGFDSIERLAETGERLVASAVELVTRFPQVARLA